jgi:hypothetical protein
VVGQSLPHVIGVVLSFADQRRHVLIVNRVEHGRAVASPFHDPPVTQKAKLVRDSGLGDSYENGEVPNRQSSTRYRGEDTDASGIRQRLRGFHDPLQLLIGRHRRPGCVKRVRIERHKIGMM